MKTVEVYFFFLRFPLVKENSLGFSSDMPSTCTRSLIQNFYFLCSIITIMAWPSSLLGTMWSSDDGLDLVHLKGHRSHLRLHGPPWLLRVQSSSTSTSHHRHISCFSTTVIIKVNVIDQDILITTYSFDSLQASVGGERGDVQRGNCR